MLSAMNSAASKPSSRRLLWSGVLFALIFPTVITWAYFVYAARFAPGVQQAFYLFVKTIQFSFPIAWVWLVLREPLRTGRPSRQGPSLR